MQHRFKLLTTNNLNCSLTFHDLRGAFGYFCGCQKPKIMIQGKYVFSQVMELFPRWVFEKAVKKYAGDFHAYSLNSFSHCLHFMFGQMAGCKSLKDISLVLKSLKKSVYHLGIPTAVDSSSLSRANEVRDYRIFE